MGELLLGVDVGTYSTKGVLVAPNGTILKSHVVPHKMDIPRPGWAEQDADKIWWQDFIEVCQAMLDGSPFSGADVGGVACSAIGPCMLPLDKAGNPLRPGILYGVDTRASVEIEWLNHELGEESIFQFSGMSLSSQAVGPKILWMKNNEPELWSKIDHITTASSYLVYRLTGEKIMDRHTASHYMPLVDIQTLEWSDKFSQQIISLDKLPRLAWSDELAGEVSAAGSQQTGLQVGTPVAVGSVDALCEGISAGVVQPGDLMIMYGSTAYFIMVLEEPLPDPRVWTVAGAYAGQYNLDAGMATTGSLTRWFRDELAQELPEETAYATLFDQVDELTPGSSGLLVLPYFSGERTPINDPDARGVIAGLTLSHTRNHLFRAVLESVAYGIRHNIETFNEMGASVQRVTAVGGGTQSATWLQIVSDVLGISQIIPEKTIGASYGDAFLAGLANGTLKRSDIEEWVVIKETISPDLQTFDVYDGLYRQYKSLYGQTRETMHFLAAQSRLQS